jgi:DNA-binding winged helix-turn-helix (wHTH) protein
MSETVLDRPSQSSQARVFDIEILDASSRSGWAEDVAAPVRLAREPDFRLGGLTVRPSLCEVEAHGRRRRLEPKVMQVLVALARADDRVVSRDELIEACWGGRIVGEDAINRCVGRLRRLTEAFEGAFSIETVIRVGYRLTPVVLEEAGPTRSHVQAKRWSLRVVIVIAVAALAIGAGAVLAFDQVSRPLSLAQQMDPPSSGEPIRN